MEKLQRRYPHQGTAMAESFLSMLDQLVTKEDLQVFKKDLLRSIQQLSQNTKQPTSWIKTKQAKVLLECSTGTLLTLRSNGTLSYSRIGGTIYYNIDDINQLLTNRRNQAQIKSLYAKKS